jgi:glycosyltransferase involved in cell wall biosynthesis
MVHGLPIVASDIPENRDLIQNGENGFLAATEIELLEKTLELIDRPDLRKTFGEKNQALARQDYALERLLREISDLYSTADSGGIHRVTSSIH